MHVGKSSDDGRREELQEGKDGPYEACGGVGWWCGVVMGWWWCGVVVWWGGVGWWCGGMK